MDRALWADWAATLRLAGRTAAIAMAPEAVSDAVWQTLEACGPLLVVLRPSAATTAEACQAVLQRIGKSRNPTLRWSHLQLPLCWLGDSVADLALAPAAGVGPALGAVCSGCALRGACAGPPQGDTVVTSVAMAVSNQFDLLLAGQGDRQVAIALPGGLQTAAVRGDCDPRVVDSALQRGQLYLDRSQQARLDDFAAQLALLLPPQTDGGAWHLANRQPFADEEAELMALLDRVVVQRGGLVVDVGAGPVRYTAALRPALQDGSLRYLAVEPDLQHLAHSRTALAEGTFVRGVGEALPLPDGCADAVMWLRSWNHLRDLQVAVREAARVLRPGGWLIAVDNVAFGLVRSADQLQRAHAIAVEQTPFEHYRNDDAAACVATLRAVLGDRVHLENVSEVGPGSSNQWLVLARVSAGRAAGR